MNKHSISKDRETDAFMESLDKMNLFDELANFFEQDLNHDSAWYFSDEVRTEIAEFLRSHAKEISARKTPKENEINTFKALLSDIVSFRDECSVAELKLIPEADLSGDARLAYGIVADQLTDLIARHLGDEHE